MTKFKLLAASIIAAGVAISVPATAAPSENLIVTKVQVDHSDLDLSSDKGQVKLQRRIRSAVREVCGNNTSRTLAETQIVMECQKQARADAMDKAEIAIALYNKGRQLAVRDTAVIGN